MSNQNEETPGAPKPNSAGPPPEDAGVHVFGEILPDELQRLVGLKQQADQIVHQIGVHSVQGHRLMDNLRQVEQASNQIVMEAGKRLEIPEGTPWSVTSEGKAVLAGTPPASRPTLVPTPPPEG